MAAIFNLIDTPYTQKQRVGVGGEKPSEINTGLFHKESLIFYAYIFFIYFIWMITEVFTICLKIILSFCIYGFITQIACN